MPVAPIMDKPSDGDIEMGTTPAPNVKQPSMKLHYHLTVEEQLKQLVDLWEKHRDNAQEAAAILNGWTDEERKAFLQRVGVEHVPAMIQSARQLGFMEPPTTVAFRNLYWKKQDSVVLNSVSGYCKPGQMLAVMGSASTFLLEVLAGQVKGGIFSGEVLLNGQVPDESHGRMVGFVSKEDTHLATLTVRETVQFSSNLRSNPAMPQWLRDMRVDAILRMLGLSHVSESYVGDGVIRGISGGEKRRLSIACELAAGHSLLVADLPTNGLDSATALDLIKKAKMACTAGYSVVFSLVQASPELLMQFDNLLLLSRGSTAYFGPPGSVQQHFRQLGFHKPSHKSLPDFLIEISKTPQRFLRTKTMPQLPEEATKENRESTNTLAVPGQSRDRDDSKREPSGSATLNYTDNASHRAASEVGWVHLTEGYANSQSFKKLGEELWMNLKPKLESAPGAATPYNTGVMQQIAAVVKREFAITMRNPAISIGGIFRSIFMGLLLGTCFYNMGESQADARVRGGLLFFVALFNAMNAMENIPLIMAKRAVFYSQANSHYFRRFTYFIAFILNNCAFLASQVVVFTIVVYGLSDLNDQVMSGRFWFLTLVTFVLAACVHALVFFICKAGRNEVVAQAITPIVLVMSSAFSGYLVPKDSIPDGWIWMYYTSPFTYALKALMLNEYQGLKFTCGSSDLSPPSSLPEYSLPPPYGFNNVEQTCQFNTGGQALRFYDMYESDPDTARWENLLYCFLWFIFWNVVAAAATVFIDWSGEILVEKETGHKVVMVEETMDEDELDSKRHNAGIKEVASYIQFNNLCYDVQVRDEETKGTKTRRLLNNVFGYCPPGTLVALMGATGAGKSTLLDVLAGKKTEGEITGEILVNGKVTDKYLSRYSGYVEQFDSHVPTATVREAVMFSAKLRLPANTPDHVRVRRVNKVLDTLGLTSVADEMIGNAEMGGLSPELRKKVTIAVELITEPGLLFLDEPTTGLNSAAAVDVMNAVRLLADEISVICTIHQPSEEIVAYFDWILLLQKGGEVAYFGPVDQLRDYFAANGFGECPKDVNVADFALEVIKQRQQQVEEEADVKDAATVFKETKRFEEVKSTLEKGIVPPGKEFPAFAASTAAGFFMQVYLLTIRFFQSEIRDTAGLTVRFVAPFTIAFVLGTLYYQLGNSQADGNNRVSMMFFAVMYTQFSSQMIFPKIISMRPIYFRESLSNMYTATTFWIARTAASIPFEVSQAVVFSIVAYWLAGLRDDDEGMHFFYFLALMLVCTFSAYGFAELSAQLGRSTEIATAAMSSIGTMFMFFCGFLIVKSAIPDPWIFMYYFNPFRYYIFFLTGNELDGLRLVCRRSERENFFIDPSNSSCIPPEAATYSHNSYDDPYCYRPYCFTTSGNQVLDFYGVKSDEFGMNFGVGVAFMVGWKILSYLTHKNINHIKR